MKTQITKLSQLPVVLFLTVLFGACNHRSAQSQNPPATIAQIPAPKGFVRVSADSGTYAHYLRHLPLKTENNIVYLYNGQPKGNQTAQYAVLKIDVGTRDLQQCADAVMRLRAEYLYQQKDYASIHFNFLGDGKPRYYTNYAGNDRGYPKFRKYMDYIFAYANTASLHREMQSVADIEQISTGDVFIQTGRPYGHAVTVMDVAQNPQTGQIVFLLSQSFMPAQDIHILKNPRNSSLSPWYLAVNAPVYTPEWTFSPADLKRF